LLGIRAQALSDVEGRRRGVVDATLWVRRCRLRWGCCLWLGLLPALGSGGSLMVLPLSRWDRGTVFVEQSVLGKPLADLSEFLLTFVIGKLLALNDLLERLLLVL
jgi:hypothetical protein